MPSYHNAKRQSSQDASQSPPGDPPAPFVSGESQGTRLLRLVPNIELFLTPEGRPFATIEIDGHEETHRIRSSTFRSYLHHLYFSHYDRAICTNALEETVGSLEARACSEGRVVAVYLRFGENGRKSYVDLGNERWEAVEISPSGKWKIVKRPAIKFWRSRGTLALPRPVRGQDGAGALRRLVNVKTDDQFHLIVAWSLGAMRPRGPHPILVLNSEQGSGKTTIAKMLRALLDPHEAPVRGMPRDEHDLFISASNGWLIALDNVSHLPVWLSDAFCRLSSGGGFGTRQLYSDDEEVVFCVQRPIILNGIEEIVTRSDLMERSIIIDPPPISTNRRRPEQGVMREFEQLRPAILAWLFDVTAQALAAGAYFEPSSLPRMADFAAWLAACEPFLGWKEGHFESIYLANRHESHQITLDSSPIGRHVLAIVSELAEGSKWSWAAADFLAILNKATTSQEKKSPEWPRSPRAASEALRRIIPSLREAGVGVTFSRKPGGNRERIISLYALGGKA